MDNELDGMVDGSAVGFMITDDLDSAYAFIEDVGSLEMHYQGKATATVSDEKMVARFDGTVLLRQRGAGGATVAQCTAPDHRLAFTR